MEVSKFFQDSFSQMNTSKRYAKTVKSYAMWALKWMKMHNNHERLDWHPTADEQLASTERHHNVTGGAKDQRKCSFRPSNNVAHEANQKMLVRGNRRY